MENELIYNILLVKYMEKYGIENEFSIFPYGFFFGDINVKIEILIEALNNEIRVDETEKYSQYLEGVK